MKTVPRNVIIDVWERQCALEEKPVRDLVERFGKEQPAMIIYLAAMSESLGEEGAESQLLPLAMMIWEAMTLANGSKLETVDPEDIDAADSVNLKTLEQLGEANEAESQDAPARLMATYNQPELLAFCLEILMARDEDAPELAPDRVGLEMIWLKTVIDCFDQ